MGTRSKLTAALVFLIAGIPVATTLAAFTIGSLLGSQEATINNTKGHHFAITLTSVTEGSDVIPGDTFDVSPVVTNTSKTEEIYVFISFEYNPNVYSLTPDIDWQLVNSGNNKYVYSYSGEDTMTVVSFNGTATFNGAFTVIAEGSEFLALTEDDLAIKVVGYGISKDIARENNADAWADYTIGGNTDMFNQLTGQSPEQGGGDNNDPGDQNID